MSKFRIPVEPETVIDPCCRLIGRTTDMELFLVIDSREPPEKRFQIRGRGKPPLSLSADSCDHAIDSLRQWAVNNARCLTTFYTYSTSAKTSTNAH